MKKSAIFPGIMSVLAFAAFWGCWWLFVTVPVKPRRLEVLPFLIPALLFGLIAWRSRNTGKTAMVTGILIPLCLIVALGYGVLLQLNMATTPVTDVQYYERAAKRVAPATFPIPIPENAENVMFAYLPAFLQGGEELTLAFTTDEIEAYAKDYISQAIWADDEEEAPPEIPYLNEPVRIAGEVLTGDYVICLLHAEPYMENNWNHGQLLAVKIDYEAGQIVYMFRDW